MAHMARSSIRRPSGKAESEVRECGHLHGSCPAYLVLALVVSDCLVRMRCEMHVVVPRSSVNSCLHHGGTAVFSSGVPSSASAISGAAGSRRIADFASCSGKIADSD